MKLEFGWRKLCSVLLASGLLLAVNSCSSSQQQAEGDELENSAQESSMDQQSMDENSGEDSAYEDASEESNYADYSEQEESVAYSDDLENQTDELSAMESSDSGDYMADETASSDASEGDLEDIISQMNEEASEIAEGDGELLGESSDMMAAAPEDTSSMMESTDASLVTNDAGMPQTDSMTVSDQAPASAARGLPEMNSKMPYIIQKGDTLAKVAEKIYGDIARWRDIADLSALANPNRIYPGDVVYYSLSPESLNFAQNYELAPKKEYTVQGGQTLASIAQDVYGSSQDWKTIWRQNGHIDNPDILEPGVIVYYIDLSTMYTQLDNIGLDLNEVLAINDMNPQPKANFSADNVENILIEDSVDFLNVNVI